MFLKSEQGHFWGRLSEPSPKWASFEIKYITIIAVLYGFQLILTGIMLCLNSMRIAGHQSFVHLRTQDLAVERCLSQLQLDMLHTCLSPRDQPTLDFLYGATRSRLPMPRKLQVKVRQIWNQKVVALC